MRLKMLVNHIGLFLEREDGPTAVEYAVMLALIIAVAIGTITVFGSTSDGWWKRNTDAIVGATGASV